MMSDTACTTHDRRIRVLLVDNSQAFLRAAIDLLKRHRELIVVSTVCKDKEILRQVQSLRPQVVLIGLDTPNLTGLKTVSRLRIALPEVTIIALTMLSGDVYRQAAFSAGADEVVTKANLSTDLIPAIRRLSKWANLTNHGEAR